MVAMNRPSQVYTSSRTVPRGVPPEPPEPPEPPGTCPVMMAVEEVYSLMRSPALAGGRVSAGLARARRAARLPLEGPHHHQDHPQAPEEGSSAHRLLRLTQDRRRAHADRFADADELVNGGWTLPAEDDGEPVVRDAGGLLDVCSGEPCSLNRPICERDHSEGSGANFKAFRSHAAKSYPIGSCGTILATGYPNGYTVRPYPIG